MRWAEPLPCSNDPRVESAQETNRAKPILRLDSRWLDMENEHVPNSPRQCRRTRLGAWRLSLTHARAAPLGGCLVFILRSGSRSEEKQPVTTWAREWPEAYGFYSNVNPKRDHPTFSQAEEHRLGSGRLNDLRKTVMFNGYADQVAGLYTGMDLMKNY